MRMRNPSVGVLVVAAVFPFAVQAELSVAFKAPGSGQTISGTLQGGACEATGTEIKRVRFYLDSAELNRDTNAPWTCVLDTTQFADGVHTLMAVAFDRKGQSTSTQVSVRIENAAPPDRRGAVAGSIATYATHWQEGLATSFSRATEEREQLEARLARAQLQSLRLQLNPHFLFNTLNTINALIGTDRRAAERVISGLSELLRMSLSTASEQEVTLARELDLLAHYIDIQQIRFQDRLTVRFAIDPDARFALVPNLVLQPLVENAIRHGIAPRAAPGHVVVTARRKGDRLDLSVVDDGVGESASVEHRDGVGLGNTRARLLSLYGADHRFEAGTPAGASGFAVAIEIPYRTDPLPKELGRHELEREVLV